MSGKLTKAQEWILKNAYNGTRVLPAGGYEVHTSFYSGRQWYGAPHRSHAACVRNGWMRSDGFITPAGRSALKEASGNE